MTPVHCRVRTDEQAGTYGDCLRACIASLLDMQPEDVPHFYDHGASADEGYQTLVEFLKPLGYAPFYAVFDGKSEREEVTSFMAAQNPHNHYLLYGQNADSDHVVICKGGRIVFDPAWFPTTVNRPCSNGFWSVMVLARL